MDIHSRVLLSLALAATVASCGGGDDWRPVSFESTGDAFYRTFPSGEYVIRSQAELVAAWATAPFEAYPFGPQTEPPMPSYDFQRSSVVGISRGRGRGCFRPYFREVLVDGQDMIVRYTAPTASTSACLYLAPEVAFVLVPRVEGQVTFEAVPP
jgi:hypothetical protein